MNQTNQLREESKHYKLWLKAEKYLKIREQVQDRVLTALMHGSTTIPLSISHNNQMKKVNKKTTWIKTFDYTYRNNTFYVHCKIFSKL